MTRNLQWGEDTQPDRPGIAQGSALVAEVGSTNVPRVPDRTLRLFYDGESAAVRTLTGDLVWLETPEIYAFREEGSGDVVVAGSDNEETALLPRDVGAEVRAMATLADLCDWAGVSGRVPNPAAGSLHIRTEEGRDLDVIVDLDTGLVLSVSESRGMRITVREWQIVPETPDVSLFELGVS